MPVPFMVRVSTSRVALLEAGLKIGCSAKWLVPWSHPIDIEAFEIPLGMLHMVDAILIRRGSKGDRSALPEMAASDILECKASDPPQDTRL